MSMLAAVSADAQYCMLPGRTSYSQIQPGIKVFKLNTINRTSVQVENPLSQPSIVVTTDTTSLQRGQTYTISMLHTRDSLNVGFATARNNIRVWIDYNNDKDFEDAGETVISADLQTAGWYTNTFTVPATAPLGTVRLRATAKMSADAGHTVPTSCDMPKDPIDYHGEMEDYHLKIMPATSVAELTNNMQVSLYPNPASSKVSVLIDSKDNQELYITLHDVTGKTLQTLLHETKQSNYRYNFDLAAHNLQTGVYYIRVASTEGQSYQKLVFTN
ncbi:hypothetical protein CAP35_11450 [Chitinophagaceae bacterium IBVUCB1]|nr:hypothetical protein CAP35_11450 [Chitinophagaceae bacterium IBVUCB1]